MGRNRSPESTLPTPRELNFHDDNFEKVFCGDNRQAAVSLGAVQLNGQNDSDAAGTKLSHCESSEPEPEGVYTLRYDGPGTAIPHFRNCPCAILCRPYVCNLFKNGAIMTRSLQKAA
jgi:hypothetical protein